MAELEVGCNWILESHVIPLNLGFLPNPNTNNIVDIVDIIWLILLVLIAYVLVDIGIKSNILNFLSMCVYIYVCVRKYGRFGNKYVKNSFRLWCLIKTRIQKRYDKETKYTRWGGNGDPFRSQEDSFNLETLCLFNFWFFFMFYACFRLTYRFELTER